MRYPVRRSPEIDHHASASATQNVVLSCVGHLSLVYKYPVPCRPVSCVEKLGSQILRVINCRGRGWGGGGLGGGVEKRDAASSEIHCQLNSFPDLACAALRFSCEVFAALTLSSGVNVPLKDSALE